MKKEVKKYVVVNELTEGQIKSEGASRWMKKIEKAWLLSLGIICAMVLIIILTDNKVMNYVTFGSWLLWGIWMYTGMYKAGKMMLKSVEKLDQPIDLRRV